MLWGLSAIARRTQRNAVRTEAEYRRAMAKVKVTCQRAGTVTGGEEEGTWGATATTRQDGQERAEKAAKRGWWPVRRRTTKELPQKEIKGAKCDATWRRTSVEKRA